MKIAVTLSFIFAVFECAHSATLGIVNGDEAVKNSIPFQAHVYLETDFLANWNCSGILISQRFVLTSARCVWSGPTHVNVTLGAHNIRENEPTQQSYYSRHDWKKYRNDFEYYTLENNIALIKLPSTVELNDYIQLAKLPTNDDVRIGQTGTISGWGMNGRELETVLKTASATVVDNSVCESAYSTLYTGNKTICVQSDNGASGCNGDGGAPLVIDGVVVGFFSGGPINVNEQFIANCTGKPNIFTKIADYLDWINGYIGI